MPRALPQKKLRKSSATYSTASTSRAIGLTPLPDGPPGITIDPIFDRPEIFGSVARMTSSPSVTAPSPAPHGCRHQTGVEPRVSPRPSDPRKRGRRICLTGFLSFNAAFGTSPRPASGERVRVRGQAPRQAIASHAQPERIANPPPRRVQPAARRRLPESYPERMAALSEHPHSRNEQPTSHCRS